MGLAGQPKNFESAGESVVAKGKFTVFCGALSAGELPANIDVCRFSAGVIVAKLDVASDRKWKILRREAQKRLDETRDDILQSIEEGIANPALLNYRRDLRAILAAKPVELTAAVNLSAIETARPQILDRPTPNR